MNLKVGVLLLEISLLSARGFAVSNSFRSSLEDAGRQYACPGEVVNYTCTVVDTSGNPPIGSSLWRGTAFNCPGSANRISLSHSLFNTSGVSGTCNNGAITAESVGVVDNCYTSRLMLTVSVGLNETTVECTLSGVIAVGSRTLLIPGAQLQSSVERPCLGERVTFICTVPSLAHLWRISSLGIARTLVPSSEGQVFSDPPFQFSVTEVRTGTSITSTATVNITADLNGTLIMCQDGIGVLPDQNSTIKLRGNNDEQCVTPTPTPTPILPTASSQAPTQLPSETPTHTPTQSPHQTITPPTTGPPSGGGTSFPNAGAFAGGVIGGLVGVVLIILIIVVIVLLIWRTKNSPRQKDEAMKPKWGKKRHSTEATPNTQEELQVDLTYEEVDTLQSQTIQLEENVAYGPVKQSQKIELKENVAYGPVKRS